MAGTHTILHEDGDGFRTETHDGTVVNHKTLGKALMHIASIHEPEEDHMHIASGDEGLVTHHVFEGGKPKGPHKHPNLRTLKQHVAKVFAEPEEEEGEEEENE
jgi:hypothetical protein